MTGQRAMEYGEKQPFFTSHQRHAHGHGHAAHHGHLSAHGHAAKHPTVFMHGHRIKMNIVPMFISAVVPWAIFVATYAVVVFLLYKHSWITWSIVGVFASFCIWCILKARKERREDPDPMWWTYFAIAVGIAVLAGTCNGYRTYSMYMEPAQRAESLKIAGMTPQGPIYGNGFLNNYKGPGVDIGYTTGESLMDVGVALFSNRTEMSQQYSWHFLDNTLYCVAPLTGVNGTVPKMSYDVWAVGKDCCSRAASDYRCGAWRDVSSVAALRVTRDKDLEYYKLAVQQAETIFGIRAEHPVFFYCDSNIVSAINGGTSSSGLGAVPGSSKPTSRNIDSPVSKLKAAAVDALKLNTIIAAVCFLFGVAMASVAFAFLGRGRTIYDMDYYDSPDWHQGSMHGVRGGMQGGGWAPQAGAAMHYGGAAF